MNEPAKERLRIAVIGAGAIGSTFAFQLARVGGHDVTAIARPNSKRLGHLQRDNGIIDVDGCYAEMHVADTLDESIAYDLIVVTVLAHQVDRIVPALQRSAAKTIQFMFNNFAPERLQEAIGAERCAFGMPFVQAALTQDGKLQATIGAAGQKCKLDRQRWVDVFVAAGLPAVLEPRMPLWLRCHVPLCVAFESVSVAAMRRGGGASWGEAITLARGVHEIFVLIERLGYPIYPAGKVRLYRCPPWVVAGMLWFMSRIPSFRALLATGVDECRALVDVLVASAERATLSTSVEAIRAMRPAE